MLNAKTDNAGGLFKAIAEMDGISVLESNAQKVDGVIETENLWMKIYARGMEGYLLLDVQDGQEVRLDEIYPEENSAGEMCNIPGYYAKHNLNDFEKIIGEIKRFIR